MISRRENEKNGGFLGTLGELFIDQSVPQVLMKIVSACPVGINCRFDGRNKLSEDLMEPFKHGELVPVCPEQLGGLPTPRVPSKIVNGDGHDILDGMAQVINQREEDVTANFLRGAKEVLKVVDALGVEEAILECRSPSCGCQRISDQDLKELPEGDGVLTALLKRNGVRVIPKC
jgi:uncharacterized protein YbbK (DUF523 family)